MGKKKRNHPDIEEVLSRPWCYYCERDFDDLKILISHQKAKHFKCDRCNRRLNTAGGLSVHLNQVHKETLSAVDNALPNRQGLDVEIFGMEGIPEDVANAHKQRVLQQYYEAQAERQAQTGNPAPGGRGANAPKKPKFESPSDLKRRLAEHKAKKAAEAAGGGISSGDVTPLQGAQSPAIATPSPASFAPSTSPFAGNPVAQVTPQASPPPYGQAPFQQPPYNGQHANFAQPWVSSPGMPSYAAPGAAPAMPTGPGASAFTAPYSMTPGQYPPPSISPPISMQHGPYGAPPGAPPAHVLPPHQPPSLPNAPGLPQRPAFGAPQVNSFQFQQMHQGHPQRPALPGQFSAAPNQASQGSDAANGHGPNAATLSASVDELIASAKQDAQADRSKSASAAPPEKPAKKDKDKNIRLVYSDNEVSPEEKMAQLPRYAFVPNKAPETALGEVGPRVAGVVVGQDDVRDPSG